MIKQKFLFDILKRKVVEFRNFRDEFGHLVEVGKSILVGEVFAEGEFLDAIATSKGKGFQGVVKRHNFGGVGQATHGQHNRLRAPGSIGACSYPARVFKGMKMAGRMGFENVTIRNLKVIKIIPEDNLIMVNGSVPGSINSIVELNKN